MYTGIVIPEEIHKGNWPFHNKSSSFNFTAFQLIVNNITFLTKKELEDLQFAIDSELNREVHETEIKRLWVEVSTFAAIKYFWEHYGKNKMDLIQAKNCVVLICENLVQANNTEK